jgi:hypothetical protein
VIADISNSHNSSADCKVWFCMAPYYARIIDLNHSVASIVSEVLNEVQLKLEAAVQLQWHSRAEVSVARTKA